ncbi:MAG: hypothetical protein M3010_02780, partial [Candidatus Dormibacteraeota bacterium]|nr:hypothetical protein [Candidatus Dormibacteraeota bacterium]
VPEPSHDPAEPTWPAEVYHPAAPTSDPHCNQKGIHRVVTSDPGSDWPRTPQEMAARATTVVLADAFEQRTYWRYNTQAADDWTGMTATNFRVVQVVKGAPVRWVQQSEIGARSKSLPCPTMLYVDSSSPLIEVGSRYLLFITPQKYSIPYFRFVVVGGTVHSEG